MPSWLSRPVVVLLGLLLVGAAVLAQTPAARRPAMLDDLLAEMKGLRADMAQSAAATVKTQLLIARLQVEEQRLNGIARQMADLESQLESVRRSIASMENDVTRFQLPNLNLSEPERQAVAGRLEELKTNLSLQQRREQELMTQESAISQQYAGEQARWTEFNDRLDALERSLPQSQIR